MTAIASNPAKPAAMLVLATGFWGASFVIMKALGLHQQTLAPRAGSWFLASACLAARFGGAALLLGLWQLRRRGGITSSEAWQGLGLGLFGGAGMLFQNDGVMHTSASTTAFLTQCYCIFIPIWIACQRRALPSAALAAACGLVVAGVTVLANIQWMELRAGRGEVETVISSVFFTGQILWLQRPAYAGNRTIPVTFVMFVTMALLALPVALLADGGGLLSGVRTFGSAPALIMIAALTLGPTIVSYGLMNHWQPHIPATHAALIYCCEPVFASLFALFLPACLSRLASIHYANEIVGWQLLAGGGLITAANLLVLWKESQPAKPDPMLVAPDAPGGM